MVKVKAQNPDKLGFRSYLGTTLMGTTDSLCAGLMSTFFLMYLTDYAGIGKWGAILGSALLIFARVFDTISDPLEGWLMDRAKVGKYGKYRPFILLSIVLAFAGVSGLFSLPSGLADSPAILFLYVLFFYLLYDIGASFYAPNLVYRTMTMDPQERGKLLMGPRMYGMVISMLCASFLTIINGINRFFHNLHTAFAVTVCAAMALTVIVSIAGLSMVRERHHVERDKGDTVKLTDIFGLLRDNAALRIKILDALFSGFIWTFLFAAMAYYMKWAYCADLTTGAVDTEKLGLLNLFSSLLMMVPLLVGTAVAGPVMKKIGSPIRFHKILILAEGGACLMLFVLHMVGLLALSPIPFFACALVVTTAIGMDYIPSETLNIEVMDYEIYRSGKDRSALCNACNKFLSKGQNAISASLIGIILTAIGYEVDSVTDTFLGELSAIPTLLNWFTVIMGLIPGMLAVISYLILRKYPVTDEIRAAMARKDA